MPNECMQHVLESGSPCWDLRTFFIRIRGIFLSSIAGLPFIGRPWLVEYLEGPKGAQDIYAKTYFYVVLILISLLAWAWHVIRKNHLKQYKLRGLKHQIEHITRDAQTSLLINLNDPHRNHSSVTDTLLDPLSLFCDKVASYITHLENADKDDITVAIKLIDHNAPIPAYRTIAVSQVLNKNDYLRSPHITEHEDIPVFWMNNGKKGVLFYHNLEVSAKNTTHRVSKNSRAYFPESAKSMMIAPINAWSSHQDNSTIGMLFFWSKKHCAFRTNYTDDVLSLADHLAQTVVSFIQLTKMHSEIENLTTKVKGRAN